eukprot:scaffold7025_cov123-Cylindrotheca_fusiformis.AAC.13
MTEHSTTADDDRSRASIIDNESNDSLNTDRAKARWSILRNALLAAKNPTSAVPNKDHYHSIHRFGGYQLLKPQVIESKKCDCWDALKRFQWDDGSSSNEDQKLQNLQVAILALAACFPAGQCLDIITRNGSLVGPDLFLSMMKDRLHPAVHLALVSEDTPSRTTILVQEGKNASNSSTRCFQYVLDSACSLFTREPMEMRRRLTLQDLISHRTNGVDNTGNICVWDSERTLACLLYHHYNDFGFLEDPTNILELGTGMAGLAATSLGLRLAQKQQHTVNITLTDGHSEGVENNVINQYLTKAFYSDNPKHPYHMLDIFVQVLLWTTTSVSQLPSQDVVMVSDCTHFQNFHAALAITTLRSLRVGGKAIFCQPNRGDSLNNFVSLLASTRATALVSLDWIDHPVIEEAHQRALNEEKDGVYDENLHHPRILFVTKLRELTDQDCRDYVQCQKNRQNPTMVANGNDEKA